MTEFITRSCKAESRYEVIIKTDSEEHYKATEDFARRLIDHAKPMTVADYIRNMTDEELAEYQCRIITAALKGMGVNMIYDHEAAVKIMLRKLQQPYEED